MPEQTNVSVIIPSYNSIKTIGRTLQALENQTSLKSIVEIIIVDSSDDDATHDFLLKYTNPIKTVIRSGYKVIPSVQRNIGAKQAKAQLICFIDSDAIPSNNWIEKIIEAYQQGYKVGGGSYLIPDFQKNKNIAWAEYFLEFSQFINTRTTVHKTNMVPSCNLFCDKKIFEDVNGFPEIRAAEDSHFGLEIARKGYQMTFHPDIRVYHIFRENKKHYLKNERMLGQYNFIYRRNSSNLFIFNAFFPVLLLPFFALVKLSFVFTRVLKSGKTNIKFFFISFPLILQGLFAWTKGVIDGVKNKSSSV